jgi:hypothetical protein
VNAVLAQRLFLPKADLPASLLNQLKRLAAFQNPEFYKKQQMRLSTQLTPRVITCAEEFPQHIALPQAAGLLLRKPFAAMAQRSSWRTSVKMASCWISRSRAS